MPNYRKLPKVIEAIQYTQNIKDAFWFSEDGSLDIPDWLQDASELPVHRLGSISLVADQTTIHTLEGFVTVSLDDYIIQGIAGEIYPCKPDIFAASYEMVMSEVDLRKLLGLDELDPKIGQSIDTHDGTWVREGDQFIFKANP